VQAGALPPCKSGVAGHSLMSVLDYGGLQVGMPVSVCDVEQAIGEASGTSDWLLPGRRPTGADLPLYLAKAEATG